MSAVDNKELVRKAVISAADTLSGSGKLNDMQADKFLDFVFDETVLSKVARTVKFRNENMDIDKIGVGNRAAMPKAEGVDPGYRRGLTTSQVTLSPADIMVPFEITDVFFEVNLEGQSVEQHIIQMFAKQLANDLEELYIHGAASPAPIAAEDEVYPGGSGSLFIADAYMGLFNGFLELADGGNAYDAGGDPLSAAVFRGMLNAMPSKFRRDKTKLRWLVPLELETLWREKVASRGTGMGDIALQGGGNLTPFGIQMVPVPLMEFYPSKTENATFVAVTGVTQSLTFGPIQSGSVRVADTSIGGTPQAIYEEGVDYSVDYTNGTITNLGAGIGADATVRVTYNAYPQMLLTHEANMIVGLGRDVRLEKDRDIFRGVNQYALSVKAAVQFEELTAVVKASNLADSI